MMRNTLYLSYVFGSAFLFSVLSKVVCHFFEPKEEMEKIRKKIEKLNELSFDALEMGDEKMYAILQKQGNELLHKLYTLIFLSAIYELTPHVIALGILQRTLPSEDFVRLPFSAFFGDSLGWFGWYISSALFWYGIFKIIKFKTR